MNPQLEAKALAERSAALITASELAKLLKISIRTLWRMRTAGKIPLPVRLGGAVRWRLTEVDKWINDGCPTPTADHLQVTE